MFAYIKDAEPQFLIKADQAFVVGEGEAEQTYSFAELRDMDNAMRRNLGIVPADFDAPPEAGARIDESDPDNIRTGQLVYDGATVTVVRKWLPPKPAPEPPTIDPAAEISDLKQRLELLERQMSNAAKGEDQTLTAP